MLLHRFHSLIYHRDINVNIVSGLLFIFTYAAPRIILINQAYWYLMRK